MISPAIKNANFRLLLSTLSLSIALFTLSQPSLLASCDDVLMEEDTKSLKRPRAISDNADTSLPLKHQKINPGTDPVFVASREHLDAVAKDRWNHAGLLPHFFMSLSFKDICAGRCVSKLWQRVLTGDEFCNAWGIHFAPSSPEEMKITPQEFIKYWSTPSITFMPFMEEDDLFLINTTLVSIKEKDELDNKYLVVSGENREDLKLPCLNNESPSEVNGVNRDGSVFVGCTYVGRETAVQWTHGKLGLLDFLNNGSAARATGISSDASIILGFATDGADENRWKMVQWIDGNIQTFSDLNKHTIASVTGASRDGSIVVGSVSEPDRDYQRIAVQWINGERQRLSFQHNENSAEATSVSSNGSVIVGHTSYEDGEMRSTVWINGEIFFLSDILERHGVDLKGYELASLNVLVSPNGLLVAGNCSRDDEEASFKAILPSKYT